MRWIESSSSIIGLVVVTLVWGLSVGLAAEDETLRIGRNGEATFTQVMKIGDQTLSPGDYRFQHRVDGHDHHVQFTSRTRGQTENAHEVMCRVEPLGHKAKYTAITSRPEGDARRIIRIEVGGENVAHVF